MAVTAHLNGQANLAKIQSNCAVREFQRMNMDTVFLVRNIICIYDLYHFVLGKNLIYTKCL